MNKIIDFSLNNRFLVMVLVLLVMVAGINALVNLPIDAVPDVTPNQVQILTNAPGLSPLEVEQFITFPVETAMSGLPGIETIRSVSQSASPESTRAARTKASPFHTWKARSMGGA